MFEASIILDSTTLHRGYLLTATLAELEQGVIAGAIDDSD